jgi:VWFA-related protein
MLNRGFLALAIFGAFAAAQDTGKEPADLSVRVTVNLVQIDAVVTDSHGNHVTDLNPGDFEILLDGKPQTLKAFEMVRDDASAASANRVSVPAGKTKNAASVEPPAIEASLKPSEVRRTIVLFVDDLSLSSDRVPFVRRALHQLVDTQMQPGDLVAIVRASAGLGALRDFTTDKTLLRAAADQVRWNPSGRGGTNAWAMDNDFSSTAAEQETRFRAEYYTIAVVESLRKLIDGMASLPGRKSVVLLSNGLPMSLPEYDNGLGLATMDNAGTLSPLGSVPDRLLHLADAATRASVVFYAIDTRLLGTAGDLFSAQPNTGSGRTARIVVNTQSVSPGGYGLSGGDNPAVPGPVQDPQLGKQDYRLERGGGMFLSSQTGGFMLYDTNDIGFAVGQVLNDSNGYYLLGFVPPAQAFERYENGKRFNRITIKVRRPGLHVRSRSGFFGEPNSDTSAAAALGGDMLAALDSPFRSDGVGVDLKCSFMKAGRNLPSIRASMIVRAQDLTLEGPVYNRSAVIHLLIRAYSVNGADLDRSADKMLRVSLNEEGYRRALKFGLVYAMEMDLAKPGPYRVRVALRDEASGRVGTANEFLVVPNLNGRQLALSGLIFPGSYGKEDDIMPAPGPIELTPGGSTRFAFEVFGAPQKAKTLQAQTRLYRDGAKVYESPLRPLQVGAKQVHGESFAGDELKVPFDLAPGDYVLQEVVTGRNAAGKNTSAWQWAELRIGPDSLALASH